MNEDAKTICFDLDGTLCTNTGGEYEAAEPFPWAIERVNRLAEAGHRIVIFTARGTASGIDWEDTTRAQLERWGVRYDELILGKPSADVYVDDRTITTESWRFTDASRIPGFPGIPGPGLIGELPVAPPAHYSCLVAAGRGRDGEADDAAEVAARLAERVTGAGLATEVDAAAIESAIREAVAASSGEVVYSAAVAERVPELLGPEVSPPPLTVSVMPGG